MSGWRLLLGAGPADGRPVEPAAFTGVVNMAVDHALLESAQRGGTPTLRLYRWNPACFSLGRNQAAAGVYDPDRLKESGYDVVRRLTGGLGVLHDDELTYSVTAPLPVFGGAREAYHRINAALVTGLRTLGVRADAATDAAPVRPQADAASPCFQHPAAGELVADGRKLVGSAQRCERRAVLQHGSLIRSGSQARVLELLRMGSRAGDAEGAGNAEGAGGAENVEGVESGRIDRAPGTVEPDGSTSLDEVLGAPPPWSALTQAVVQGFQAEFGICLAPGGLSDDEAERVRELTDFYADPDWTWRC